MRHIQSLRVTNTLCPYIDYIVIYSLFHASVVEEIVGQAPQVIMREVNDAQALDRFEYILGNVTEVIVAKEDQLELFGVLEGIKVQFVDPVVAEVQPLQVGHVAEDITSRVLKGQRV